MTKFEIVSESDLVATWPARSETCTLKVAVPGVVGVPETIAVKSPVPELSASDKPAGNVPLTSMKAE